MSSLFSPCKVGNYQLQHRVAMAPVSRCRADEQGVPLDIMVEYYSQRASVPGTLIVGESTCVSLAASGRYTTAPGIYSKAQIEGWKKVTAAVHDKNSVIFCQLWAVGRAVQKDALEAQGIEAVSSSGIPVPNSDIIPRALTAAEIEKFIHDFVNAAKNAMDAGFDGVEIHAANGYLIDQFTQDTCNQRIDEWGGNIENRSRFCLRIAAEVVQAIGAGKVGIRLSPFSPYQGMAMKDTIPQFIYLIRQLNLFNLAYLHLVDPRIFGSKENIDFAVNEWNSNSAILLNGGYDAKEAQHQENGPRQGRQVLIAFGRWFISNPDLPYRLRQNLELNPFDPKTFYTPKQPTGYNDYPFHKTFGAYLSDKVH